MEYKYIGDRITRSELKGAICVSVLRENGKCVRGRNANMLVFFPGVGKVVVCGRLLRKIK